MNKTELIELNAKHADISNAAATRAQDTSVSEAKRIRDALMGKIDLTQPA